MQKLLLSLVFLVSLANGLQAQLTLLLERSGQDQSERRFEGDQLRYRLAGDRLWREGAIQEMRPDINSLVINDRYVKLSDIEQLDLGNARFLYAGGLGLQTFGVGWGFFALVGYATDGNSETSISGADLMVAGTAFVTGFIISKLARRRFKVNRNRRLRIVDLTF
ncbi:MAG: hypothetical protein AAF433_04990 [Bacteroidota bacterium]